MKRGDIEFNNLTYKDKVKRIDETIEEHNKYFLQKYKKDVIPYSELSQEDLFLAIAYNVFIKNKKKLSNRFSYSMKQFVTWVLRFFQHLTTVLSEFFSLVFSDFQKHDPQQRRLESWSVNQK